MRSRIKVRILVLKIGGENIERITQEDVAKRIGISTNYYCSIEKGERQQDMKASILIALSEVLRIPVSEMLSSERKLNLNS